ncbi:hypothetical protein CLIB1444_14S00980 [[Candida] jaroonii]|uniref:Uncharacterized protein n=1 Tax=[Candida] jaroonii TaxID=467808 RepID=A0ACA9YEG3_9ASCO|nr:hypothetical protein CLIB1444_14S00980 [[Candida] jaroonii]
MKPQFLTLGKGILIDLHDNHFWSRFWSEITTINDIDITIEDIHHVKSQNAVNFMSLIYKCFMKLKHYADSDTCDAHLLNVIHILTRLVPVLYEDETISTKFLRSRNYSPFDFIPSSIGPPGEDNGDILAMTVLQSIVKLLFLKGFTCKRVGMWEPGMGFTAKYQTPDLVMENNRSLVLKLLIVLCGDSMYQSPLRVASKGSLFTSLLVSALPKQETLTLTCSLINVLCRSTRSDNAIEFNDNSLKVSRHSYVCNCAQLLTIMLIYPLPKDPLLDQLLERKPYNMPRLYITKLHKDSEILFFGSALVNGLKTDDYRPPLLAMEFLMIFWELYQCNARFRIIGEPLILELMIILVHYIKSFTHPQYKNLTKLCCMILLSLSYNPPKKLMDPYHDISLPNASYENGPTLRDIIVIHICQILSKHVVRPEDQFLVSTLVEIVYNVVPLLGPKFPGTNDHNKKLNNLNPDGGLSYPASTSLTNLVVRFSSKPFLLKNPANPDLLALLVRSICIAAFHNRASRMLVFTMLKSEKIFETLATVIGSLNNEYFDGNTVMYRIETLASAETTPVTIQATQTTAPTQPTIQSNFQTTQSIDSAPQTDDEEESPEPMEAEEQEINESLRPTKPSGMSKKFKGKQKLHDTISNTWSGKEALRIINSLIIPFVKNSLNDIFGDTDTFTLVEHIEKLDFEPIITTKSINHEYLPTSKFTPLKFHWGSVSLGWYTSLVYFSVYYQIDNVSAVASKNKLIKNITSFMSFGMFSDASSNLENPETISDIEKTISSTNVWNGTAIKLFKIENNTGFFDSLNHKLVNESRLSLSRRLSDLRFGKQSPQMSPNLNSGLSTPKEDQESYFPRKNSVTSLHSLNTLNRSRTATPRNSISM